MLCIDRREQQSVLIGDDIEIIIAEVHGKNARLAIRAPKEMLILRKELLGKQKKDVKNDVQV